MTDIATIARDIARIRRDTKRHFEDIKARRYAIKQDKDITGEQREIKLRQLSEEGQEKYRLFAQRWERLDQQANEEAKRTRSLLPVDEAATARVRSLSKGGMADNLIITKALELGDDDALEALRRERLWHNDGKTFTDARDTIAACDRALAQIGRGEGQRKMNRALVKIDEVREPMPTLMEYAGKVALDEDTPHDLLTLAFATGAGKEDNDA